MSSTYRIVPVQWPPPPGRRTTWDGVTIDGVSISVRDGEIVCEASSSIDPDVWASVIGELEHAFGIRELTPDDAHRRARAIYDRFAADLARLVRDLGGVGDDVVAGALAVLAGALDEPRRAALDVIAELRRHRRGLDEVLAARGVELARVLADARAKLLAETAARTEADRALAIAAARAERARVDAADAGDVEAWAQTWARGEDLAVLERVSKQPADRGRLGRALVAAIPYARTTGATAMLEALARIDYVEALDTLDEARVQALANRDVVREVFAYLRRHR